MWILHLLVFVNYISCSSHIDIVNWGPGPPVEDLWFYRGTNPLVHSSEKFIPVPLLNSTKSSLRMSCIPIDHLLCTANASWLSCSAIRCLWLCPLWIIWCWMPSSSPGLHRDDDILTLSRHTWGEQLWWCNLLSLSVANALFKVLL